MASFLVRSNLSVGDLRLFLSNEDGYPQDAVSVKWSIYDPTGVRVSGENVPAIRKNVGEYYAPWYSDVRNGNYSIRWSIQETWASELRTIENKFFVIDPSTYQVPGCLPQQGIPLHGGFTYLTGSNLGPDDLPLYLRDENGFLFDAYSVFWSIRNSSGDSVLSRSEATHSATGSYFAPLQLNFQSGEYSILWEYQKDPSSPMQSIGMGFTVINPTDLSAFGLIPFSGYSHCSCPSSCQFPSWDSSCGIDSSCSGGVPNPHFDLCSNDSVEIPATMHLPIGPLPAAGAYTDQFPYQVPHCVRRLSFYITYQRGAPGGYATFKIMWGNGVDEYSETIVDYGNPSPLSLQTLIGPAPIDDDEVKFVVYMTIPGGCVSARLLAAETGMPGTPGICSITLTASSS